VEEVDGTDWVKAGRRWDKEVGCRLRAWGGLYKCLVADVLSSCHIDDQGADGDVGARLSVAANLMCVNFCVEVCKTVRLMQSHSTLLTASPSSSPVPVPGCILAAGDEHCQSTIVCLCR
jgi:hypothetical protein